MKNIHLTPASSVKSTTTASTAIAAEGDQSETRDSCYYPGCRKDANCNCEMCLASINATLDLIQKSSLTKISISRPTIIPNIERTPISFKSSILSTPRSSSPPTQMSPCIGSSTKVNLEEKMKKEKRKIGSKSEYSKLALLLTLILLAEYGFSWAFSSVLKPSFSPQIVSQIGKKSEVVKDLNGKLRFLQKEFQGIVDGPVSNCSYVNSKWEINQDGVLLSSRCTLFKSPMEEISIWGWPLQTAGLLKTGFSSRSFTVISGRVTEWMDGRVNYVIWKENSSWTHHKLGVSAVQLDPNTWLLEYRRSLIFDNPRLVSTTLAFLKYRTLRMFEGMKQEFWLSSTCEFKLKFDTKVPT